MRMCITISIFYCADLEISVPNCHSYILNLPLTYWFSNTFGSLQFVLRGFRSVITVPCSDHQQQISYGSHISFISVTANLKRTRKCQQCDWLGHWFRFPGRTGIFYFVIRTRPGCGAKQSHMLMGAAKACVRLTTHLRLKPWCRVSVASRIPPSLPLPHTQTTRHHVVVIK